MYHRERKTGHAEAKESAVQLIKTVRRQMRTKYGTEGKIPMILEGWRGRPSGGRTVLAGGGTLHIRLSSFLVYSKLRFTGAAFCASIGMGGNVARLLISPKG
jgi:hypothetical protein